MKTERRTKEGILNVLKGFLKINYTDLEFEQKLSTITDFDRLVVMWRYEFSGSKREGFIEVKIGEVLSNIKDFNKLVEMLMKMQNALSESKLENFVKTRIGEVITNLQIKTIDDIPMWFLYEILEPNSRIFSCKIDWGLRLILEEKAREIYSLLK